MVGENDSILTFGLEVAEATEQSVGEIASGLKQEFGGPQQEQAASAQEVQPQSESSYDLALQREEAQRAQEQELDGPER